MKRIEELWFSVVIPLYNKEPHIADTLTSVLAQTYPNFELIVVNDASTDGSRDVVSQFSDKRIRTVERKEPGPGGYAARNRGIREAQHNWIAFLDADDVWCPSFLEKMKSVIEENFNTGFFASGWYESTNLTGKVTNTYCQKYGHVGPHRIDLTTFLEKSTQNLGPVCSSVAIVKKDLIREAGLFPENVCRFGGDIDTWFRIMIKGNHLVINPVPLATYNKEAINMVTKKNQLQTIETCVRKTALKLFESNAIEKRNLVKRFVNHYQYLQVRKKGMAAQLDTVDLRFVFKWANPGRFILFFFFSLLPFRLQHLIIKIYTSFK